MSSRRSARSCSPTVWPGNVRELQNCIERAVALTRYEELTVRDLPEKIRDYRDAPLFLPGQESGELLPMEEVERRHIMRVLKSVGGNKTMAAEVLGFDRTHALPQAGTLW